MLQALASKSTPSSGQTSEQSVECGGRVTLMQQYVTEKGRVNSAEEEQRGHSCRSSQKQNIYKESEGEMGNGEIAKKGSSILRKRA